MNNRFLKILILTISFLSLYACNRSSAPRVSSVIQDKSCSPPCWHHISPGTTTRKDVKPLLEQIPWVRRDSIEDAYSVSPGDSIKWMGSSTAADYSGRIYFNDDIVTLIEVNPKKNALSFSDVINEYGEPEKILILRNKVERSIVSVFILYPTEGFGFIDYYFSDIDLGETVQIAPDEEVKSAWYGKVDEFYNYLTEGQVDRLSIGLINQGIQEWHGYGEYTYIEE